MCICLLHLISSHGWTEEFAFTAESRSNSETAGPQQAMPRGRAGELLELHDISGERGHAMQILTSGMHEALSIKHYGITALWLYG